MSDDTDGENEEYCERHDLDLSRLPKGYDGCPLCEEEANIQAEWEHMVTRDPTMEPW